MLKNIKSKLIAMTLILVLAGTVTLAVPHFAPVKAKAATGDAVDIGFQYAAVIQNSDGSKDCHFVLNNGISTPEYNYQLPIYFNDKEVTALVNYSFLLDWKGSEQGTGNSCTKN